MAGKQKNIYGHVLRLFWDNPGREITSTTVARELKHLITCTHHINSTLSKIHSEHDTIYRTECGVYVFSPVEALEEYDNRTAQLLRVVEEKEGRVTLDDLLPAMNTTPGAIRGFLTQLRKKGYKVERKVYYDISKPKQETADV